MCKHTLLQLSRLRHVKVLMLSILALVAASSLTATEIPGAQAGTKRYTLNSKVGKSTIEFVSDTPVEKFNGTADGISGGFNLDASNLENTNGTIDVTVLSMKTANSKRDEHMYDANWLDATKYPTITFNVKSLKDVKVSTKDGRSVVNAKAVGSFTCHGVTTNRTADIVITYVAESAETRKRASGNLIVVDASFVVKLADHGVKGKSGVIGKSVGETIEVKAQLFSNS